MPASCCSQTEEKPLLALATGKINCQTGTRERDSSKQTQAHLETLIFPPSPPLRDYTPRAKTAKNFIVIPDGKHTEEKEERKPPFIIRGV